MIDKLKTIRPSRYVLGTLVAFTLASILFSGRPIAGYGVSVVEEVMVFPDTAPRADWLRRQTTVGELPYPNGRARLWLADTVQPVKLGYVYTEYGIFGMPYWAQPDSELGMFVYSEGVDHIGGTPVDPRRIQLLEMASGVSVPREHSSLWYKHIWGWLFPILFLTWLLLWRREDRKREEEELWSSDAPSE
ncbi:MAG TPA: hypothetical protein VGO55_06980 [Allosphingosinicella sp.]|jgi:hypothetical protein|nr:hypothetical protein [Allosphingosinicella sp.]